MNITNITKSKRRWIIESLGLTKRLVGAQILVLAALFLIGCILSITLEDTMQSLPQTEETQRWLMQLGLGLWDLFEGIVLMIVLSHAIPRVRNLDGPEFFPRPFGSPYLTSFLAEYLRLLAQILMWGILLIVPGFVRYCQLIFVPFIALFANSYRTGEEDALRLAETMSKGRLFTIFFAVGLTMALAVAFEFLPQMVPELHIVPIRALCMACSFLISVWTYSLIFLMFESVLHEISAEN